MLRAVYVTDTLADVRMVRELAARSASFTVLAPASMGDRIVNFDAGSSFSVVRLPGGRLAFVGRAAWWLVRNRRRFDVAFTLDSLLAALAANVARRLGGPAVVLQLGRPVVDYVRCQDRVLPRPVHRLKVAVTVGLTRLNERMADGAGCVSDYVRDDVAHRNRQARTIYAYGVDTDVFSAVRTRAEARVELGLPADAPVVLYRSRIAPEKDPRTFVEAVGCLRAAGRAVHAIYQGGEIAEFREVAEAAGVEVQLVDAVPPEDLPLWYIAADVAVQTSRAEGLGISPLEALACGTPVVVTATGGLPETVDGGRCGIIVPPGDPEATAGAVARLLDDPELSAAFAQRGRQLVRERFGSSAAFAAWMDLAGDVVARRRGSRRAPARRRVLFVNHETRLSGGERDLVDLVRALDPTRVEMHAALPDDGPLAAALREHGVEMHLVPMAMSLRKLSRWRLARRPDAALRQGLAMLVTAGRLTVLVRRLRPDVVHTNSMKAHLLAVPAARLGRVPLVWHVRDVLERSWLQRVFLVVARVGPRRIACLSEAAAEPLRIGALASKVRVVYNGIRLQPLEVDDVRAERTRFGAGDGDVLVGMVGQIAHWKGQDVFIEAAGILASRRPDLRFGLVGECLFPENEADYEAALKARIGELGLGDRLVWAGHLDPIDPVMAAFDLCVHASRLPEPFGRVVVEAMAAGTPVIASTRGAGPELVTPAVGRLVEPGDPVALADAIDELTADPAARAAASVAARAQAARFDISMTAAAVENLWDELDQ